MSMDKITRYQVGFILYENLRYYASTYFEFKLTDNDFYVNKLFIFGRMSAILNFVFIFKMQKITNSSTKIKNEKKFKF